MLKSLDQIGYKRETEIVQSILKYAKFLVQRDFICNTFGNIAVRDFHETLNRDVIYTKHRGVSLEESDENNIVIMDIETDQLLKGSVPPSIGYKMNREIFEWRSDVNAIIHLHPNEILSYFSILHPEGMPFISNDTAMVLQKPVKILAPDVNIELDLSTIKDFIMNTNCIVMPQHGITTLGKNISEAYHRACSIVAETKRLLQARILAANTGYDILYINQEEVNYMYKIGKEAIYGK